MGDGINKLTDTLRGLLGKGNIKGIKGIKSTQSLSLPSRLTEGKIKADELPQLSGEGVEMTHESRQYPDKDRVTRNYIIERRTIVEEWDPNDKRIEYWYASPEDVAKIQGFRRENNESTIPLEYLGNRTNETSNRKNYYYDYRGSSHQRMGVVTKSILTFRPPRLNEKGVIGKGRLGQEQEGQTRGGR